ncbi:hypothetical protein CEUSTIGMA_g12792.t1 [Chlamydomonas eustigma]|uniref:Uncharacterized protein n=1 Tax=Chlamydomonas eustigma TaxID=1157962 RepID=A0A250XQP5_9CHLO|nr:hypothetical protein CEUSTIGMA_g12792.t1 [Chlamydomonas eustigma]|eukprot:GAX85375.1 hypothetical protein CEUSTIGMA_g12792.t1 [Chlamydomonas eustigma]
MELGAISTERHHQSNHSVSNRSATPGPSHRRSTTPAPPPRTSTAGLTKLTNADRIVAQAGSTCAPLPQQQPDHLPMSNTTLASPPPPSLPSPLSIANTSPSLSSENFVSTTTTTPAPSAFSPSLLRPLARFIAGLAADPKKTAAVADWPLPSDITSVRSFLGFTGFYRRYCPLGQDLAVYQPNMSIIYKDGKNNHADDALSRLLPASLDTSAPLAPSDSQSHSPPSPAISSLLLNQLLDLCPTHVLHADPLLDDIKAAYALDPFYADSNDPRRPKYLLCRDSL